MLIATPAARCGTWSSPSRRDINTSVVCDPRGPGLPFFAYSYVIWWLKFKQMPCTKDKATRWGWQVNQIQEERIKPVLLFTPHLFWYPVTHWYNGYILLLKYGVIIFLSLRINSGTSFFSFSFLFFTMHTMYMCKTYILIFTLTLLTQLRTMYIFPTKDDQVSNGSVKMKLLVERHFTTRRKSW